MGGVDCRINIGSLCQRQGGNLFFIGGVDNGVGGGSRRGRNPAAVDVELLQRIHGIVLLSVFHCVWWVNITIMERNFKILTAMAEA